MANRGAFAQPKNAPTPKYQYLFLGNYYLCRNFGHKAINCRVKVESDYITPKKTSPRFLNKEAKEFANPNYNPFVPLMNNSVKCYKCHKLGHKACRSMLEDKSV